MTRDYNKQRRDDVRPSSRNQFTSRQRDEQSPRPARPRLNRETVDRAWEAGASTQHADYRPRRSNTFNGQAPRDNRRYNQSSEQSSAPNGRKPFGNRPDSNRRFERATPDNNSSFRSRSFNSDRGRFDDQRHHDYRQRPEDRYNSGNRPGFRDRAQPPAYERRSPYRDNDQNRGFQRREPDRQPREFGRGNRSPRDFGDAPREFRRDNRSPRNFGDTPREFGRNGRPQRSFERRSDYKPPIRDAQNPRWQSRPNVQHASSFNRQAEDNEFMPQNEQFEGDYERFSAREYQEKRPERPTGRPFQAKRVPERVKPQPEERHVTRLPDGRVLKGPRPVQRKNAQFWTGVTQETESLLEPVVAATPLTEKATDQEVTVAGDEAEISDPAHSVIEPETPKTPRTPRGRAATTTARKKKTDTVTRPRSAGPKPSKRGFKWPTP